LSVILFVSGHFIFEPVFSFFEPHIEGIQFQITDPGALGTTSLLFACVLGSIPLLLVLTWNIACIKSPNKKVASVILVLILICIAVLLRHRMVKMYFIRVVKPALLPGGTGNIVYPINPVNFVYYMFVALCTGCLLSYLLFRKKKNTITS
jgi:hypothetical protein